jgi:hypothetical protein
LTATAQNPAAATGPAILDDADAAGRLLALTQLQAALTEAEVQSVLARNHRLVLRSSAAPLQPSGLTDPRLYILLPGRNRTATTDGTSYRLDDGSEVAADDPAGAAAVICAQADPSRHLTAPARRELSTPMTSRRPAPQRAGASGHRNGRIS